MAKIRTGKDILDKRDISNLITEIILSYKAGFSVEEVTREVIISMLGTIVHMTEDELAEMIIHKIEVLLANNLIRQTPFKDGYSCL